MRILITAFLLFFLFSCSKKEEKILPIERDLTESVYSSVIIQPDSLYQAYAIVSGILEHNLVDEGDIIAKNTPLAHITNNAPKLNTENARLAFELAKENYSGSADILDNIKDEIEVATLKFKNDSVNFFRQQNLWNQNIGSKVEYDTKKLNFEVSLNNLKLLQNKYNRTKNELQTAVKQARNNYQSALINTKDFTVKSSINGKVYALYKEPGEIVNSMEPVASVGSAHNFIINMLVDEVDIVRIATNQEVIVKLDAYANEVFKGKVSKIYPKKDERNQTFTVEATFLTPPKVLYPGLSGEANIIIATKEKVLTIPKEYLTNNSQVKTDGGLITVETGLQNLEYIEVTNGITKNTYLYKPE